MFRLKYRVTKMNNTLYIIYPKYRYNRYIVIRYRALIVNKYIVFYLLVFLKHTPPIHCCHRQKSCQHSKVATIENRVMHD